jgi:hypothetical protein
MIITTMKQIAANRKNGKKGGVKTTAGKAISRYNARKHGLLSKESLLPTEDANELSQLKAGMVNALKPQDELQATLVDTIVSCFWRKRRAISYERKTMDGFPYFSNNGLLPIPSDIVPRYEMALDRQFYRALAALKELQKTE